MYKPLEQLSNEEINYTITTLRDILSKLLPEFSNLKSIVNQLTTDVYKHPIINDATHLVDIAEFPKDLNSAVVGNDLFAPSHLIYEEPIEATINPHSIINNNPVYSASTLSRHRYKELVHQPDYIKKQRNLFEARLTKPDSHKVSLNNSRFKMADAQSRINKLAQELSNDIALQTLQNPSMQHLYLKNPGLAFQDIPIELTREMPQNGFSKKKLKVKKQPQRVPDAMDIDYPIEITSLNNTESFYDDLTENENLYDDLLFVEDRRPIRQVMPVKSKPSTAMVKLSAELNEFKRQTFLNGGKTSFVFHPVSININISFIPNINCNLDSTSFIIEDQCNAIHTWESNRVSVCPTEPFNFPTQIVITSFMPEFWIHSLLHSLLQFDAKVSNTILKEDCHLSVNLIHSTTDFLDSFNNSLAAIGSDEQYTYIFVKYRSLETIKLIELSKPCSLYLFVFENNLHIAFNTLATRFLDILEPVCRIPSRQLSIDLTSPLDTFPVHISTLDFNCKIVCPQVLKYLTKITQATVSYASKSLDADLIVMDITAFESLIINRKFNFQSLKTCYIIVHSTDDYRTIRFSKNDLKLYYLSDDLTEENITILLEIFDSLDDVFAVVGNKWHDIIMENCSSTLDKQLTIEELVMSNWKLSKNNGIYQMTFIYNHTPTTMPLVENMHIGYLLKESRLLE